MEIKKFVKGERVIDVFDISCSDPWKDDHILCANIIFTDQTGNKRTLDLMWIGDDIGACHYANDSESARKKLIELINSQLELDEESEETEE